MSVLKFVVSLNSSILTHLQYPPRVILVIGNATVTHSSGCHGFGIDAGVRTCGGSEGHGFLGSARVIVELLVASLGITALLAAPEEESGTDECGNNDYADNDTGSNSSSVGSSLLRLFGF